MLHMGRKHQEKIDRWKAKSNKWKQHKQNTEITATLQIWLTYIHTLRHFPGMQHFICVNAGISAVVISFSHQHKHKRVSLDLVRGLPRCHSKRERSDHTQQQGRGTRCGLCQREGRGATPSGPMALGDGPHMGGWQGWLVNFENSMCSKQQKVGNK